MVISTVLSITKQGGFEFLCGRFFSVIFRERCYSIRKILIHIHATSPTTSRRLTRPHQCSGRLLSTCWVRRLFIFFICMFSFNIQKKYNVKALFLSIRVEYVIWPYETSILRRFIKTMIYRSAIWWAGLLENCFLSSKSHVKPPTHSSYTRTPPSEMLTKAHIKMKKTDSTDVYTKGPGQVNFF